MMTVGIVALMAVGALVREVERGQGAEVGITFGPDLKPDQLEHLFAAQSQLRKAGVSFDTGYGMTDNTRDWEWDWSLSGPVQVKHRRFRGDKPQR